MAKEQAKGREKMLRLSPFEVEYEDIQINNHAIAPTVLKQNVTRQRMPERNLLMKFRLNKPLVFKPNTSQRNFEGNNGINCCSGSCK
jgi:hypothetical protein